jgi:hypothetical protein
MTSAYNLGNSGLASKVLRIKDLMRVVTAEADSVSGLSGIFGELLGMSPVWGVEISQ